MNRHRVIKVTFGCAHFDSNGKTLNHLIDAKTYTMQAHHFFFLTHTNQLHVTRLTVLGHCTIHRGKTGFIDFNRIDAIAFDRLFFTQPYSTNRWMAKNHARH